MRAKWVKYKKLGGPRVRGMQKYDPPQPHGPWTKIMGVVARCEGAHDTVVMYDETGVTWGFMQWTFKSGRLQKLLESFKSIPAYDFQGEGAHNTFFDMVCCVDSVEEIQKFEAFGFRITGGKFVDLKRGRALNMNNRAQQKRCVDICMGRVQHPDNLKKQRAHALGLANLFAEMGTEFGVDEAQIQFAKQEFKRQMLYKRPPLGKKSIKWLLDTGGPNKEKFHALLLALFFTSWQNNPGAAYRLFKKARMTDAETYFNNAWWRMCLSKFGNWGYGKSQNRSPRVVRIKRAIMEFYGIGGEQLPLYKPKKR